MSSLPLALSAVFFGKFTFLSLSLILFKEDLIILTVENWLKFFKGFSYYCGVFC